jgi:hypothetical protein
MAKKTARPKKAKKSSVVAKRRASVKLRAPRLSGREALVSMVLNTYEDLSVTQKNKVVRDIEKAVEDLVTPRFNSVDAHLKKLDDKIESGFKRIETALAKLSPKP